MKKKLTAILLFSLILSGCASYTDETPAANFVSDTSSQTAAATTTTTTTQTEKTTVPDSQSANPQTKQKEKSLWDKLFERQYSKKEDTVKKDPTIIERPSKMVDYAQYVGNVDTKSFSISEVIDQYAYINDKSITLNCAFEVKGAVKGGKIAFAVFPDKLGDTAFRDICIFKFYPEKNDSLPMNYKDIEFDEKKHLVIFPAEEDIVYIPVDRRKYKDAMLAVIDEHMKHNSNSSVSSTK